MGSKKNMPLATALHSSTSVSNKETKYSVEVKLKYMSNFTFLVMFSIIYKTFRVAISFTM